MARGKHAARSGNRELAKLRCEVDALTAADAEWRQRTRDAEARANRVARKVTNLETERDKAVEKQVAAEAEAARWREVAADRDKAHREAASDAWSAFFKMGQLLGWDAPTLDEFVQKNAPAAHPERGEFVSDFGVHPSITSGDGRRVIQTARGLRKS